MDNTKIRLSGFIGTINSSRIARKAHPDIKYSYRPDGFGNTHVTVSFTAADDAEARYLFDLARAGVCAQSEQIYSTQTSAWTREVLSGNHRVLSSEEYDQWV